MKKKKGKVEDERDIIDILLDEDNLDPITLYDENLKAIMFEQVAVIPLNDKLYAILKPIDKIKYVEEDEAIVFRVDENDEREITLVIEDDEHVASEIFEQYYKLVEASEQENNKDNKIIEDDILLI